MYIICMFNITYVLLHICTQIGKNIQMRVIRHLHHIIFSKIIEYRLELIKA